jgi:hypothetical protein
MRAVQVSGRKRLLSRTRVTMWRHKKKIKAISRLLY